MHAGVAGEAFETLEAQVTKLQLIARVTGMNFCDRYCDCGQNNRLWWFPVGGGHVRSWVPGWMNGGTTEEIWEWLVEHGKVRRRAEPPNPA